MAKVDLWFLLFGISLCLLAVLSIPFAPVPPAPQPPAIDPLVAQPIPIDPLVSQPVLSPVVTPQPLLNPVVTPQPFVSPIAPVDPTVVAQQQIAQQLQTQQQVQLGAAAQSQVPYGGPAPTVSIGPDLVLDGRPEVLQTDIVYKYFPPGDCSVVEGCVRAPGWRRLLRFNSNIYNAGNADLVLGSPEAPSSAGFYEYSSCHGHYHRSDVLMMRLEREDGTVVTQGAKIGVCMEDTTPYDTTNANPLQRYDCNNQGVQRGWSDIYTKDLDCQHIDITDIPSGTYLLRMTVNANRRIAELNYDNNEAVVRVNI